MKTPDPRKMLTRWTQERRMARVSVRTSRARYRAVRWKTRGARQSRIASALPSGGVTHLPWAPDREDLQCRTWFWYTRYDYKVDQRIAEQRFSCHLIGKPPPAYEVLLERELTATQPNMTAVTIVAALCVAVFYALAAPVQLLGFLSVFPALGAMRIVVTAVALRRLRLALKSNGTRASNQDGASVPNVS